MRTNYMFFLMIFRNTFTNNPQNKKQQNKQLFNNQLLIQF
jgi:hypothetical protein